MENTEIETIDLENATHRGARAFLNNDYKAVIYWLRPHLKDLCPLSKKKLLLSIKRFNGGIPSVQIPQHLQDCLQDDLSVEEAIRASDIKFEKNRLERFARDPYQKGIGIFIGTQPTATICSDNILNLIVAELSKGEHPFPIKYFFDEKAKQTATTLYIRDQVIEIDVLDIPNHMRRCRALHSDLWGLS